MKQPGRRVGPTILLAALLLAAPAGVGHAQNPVGCLPGQAPTFGPGLAALAEQLGAILGEPVDCERLHPAGGDLIQFTSTGLAYVRHPSGSPSFTDGWEHWALTPAGLRCWSGVSSDPPAVDEAPIRFAAVSPGAADPWVAGQDLPATFSPAPFAVAAGDVVGALKRRCLPVLTPVGLPETAGADRQPSDPISRAAFRDARLVSSTEHCSGGCEVRRWGGRGVADALPSRAAARGRHPLGRRVRLHAG